VTARLSRPCYDKWWRCPGWAGGGMKYAKQSRCPSGSIGNTCTAWVDGRSGWRWKWHFHRCPECRIVVLPWLVRYVDPTWWRSAAVFWWRYQRPGAS